MKIQLPEFEKSIYKNMLIIKPKIQQANLRFCVRTYFLLSRVKIKPARNKHTNMPRIKRVFPSSPSIPL